MEVLLTLLTQAERRNETQFFKEKRISFSFMMMLKHKIWQQMSKEIFKCDRSYNKL